MTLYKEGLVHATMGVCRGDLPPLCVSTDGECLYTPFLSRAREP